MLSNGYIDLTCSIAYGLDCYMVLDYSPVMGCHSLHSYPAWMEVLWITQASGPVFSGFILFLIHVLSQYFGFALSIILSFNMWDLSKVVFW